MRMLRNAHGVDRPPADDASRLDLRAFDALLRLLAELDGWRELAGTLSREDVLAAIERLTLRPQRGDETGRVAVVDLLRSRTRRFEATFVLGLEEGSLPRRGGGSPFLDDEARRELDERGARLARPDSVSRDRYLFYTACTRASRRLYLVREPADADHEPAHPRAARLSQHVRDHGARALRRLLVRVVRRAVSRAEDDRRRARRDAARVGRAHGAPPVLLSHPCGARRGEARAR